MITPEMRQRLEAHSLAERNKAIRDAAAEGGTVREIAEAVGLSVGGVHRILKEEP